jgi:ABC-type sugar transport system permease subunit
MILSTHGVIASQIQSYAFLLDTYTSAAAAYSLRKLRSAYTGSAIRVRRASDNAEQNIGFSSSFGLDTTSLTSFCSGTNGFVTTWYDQSGSGRNATQTTAANQPQIVSSGSVITTNTKPAMTFSGLSNYFQFSSNFASFNNTSIFNVVEPSTYGGAAANARFYDLYDGTNHIQYLRDSGTGLLHTKNTLWQSVLNATQYTTQSAPTVQFLSSVLALSSSSDLYFNNSIQSQTSSSNVGSAGTIGVIAQRADILSITQFLGNYQEFIVYQSNQSTNLTGINSNINTYYGIY